jgi:type IV secretion system protein TrbJ
VKKWKLTAGALALGLLMHTQVNALMPVIDYSNLEQTSVSALKAVQQTATQVQQYQTQLQQYEDELKNTVGPEAYLWSQINSTINSLMQATDTLKYYKEKYGSIQSYLGTFQDTSSYSNLPCFNGKGCTVEQRAALMKKNDDMSALEKKSTDSAVMGMDQQFDSLQKDSARLKELQANAQTATGRMAAVQYANQMASEQTSQLMQMRALMLAQQDLVVKHMQVADDKKSQQDAALKAATATPKNWNSPPIYHSINPF